MALTEKQRRVFGVLSLSDMQLTPTEIGEKCGKSYDRASSWANGALRALEERGMVEQVYPRGPWRINERWRCGGNDT